MNIAPFWLAAQHRNPDDAYCALADFYAERERRADPLKVAAGGEVIGVLPEALSGREIAHNGLTSLELVSTMHERKARIHELSDAILALPGGFGTLDELLEAITWAQIGLHAKPCILINTLDYWNGLLAFLDTAVEAGFIEAKNRALVRVAGDAAEAIAMAVKLA